MGGITMPYSAEISRANPTCFLFLIDQSISMKKTFGRQPEKCKAEGVADNINRLLQTLVFRCAKGNVILDRYYIGVIGYGEQVGSGLGGALAGQGLVPVSQIGNNPLRIETRTKKVEDGAGGLVEQTVKFPIWFEPVAEGKTPMCEALQLAREAIEEFVRNCPACFPPIIVNITDGVATDGNPEPAAAALKNVTSEDGNILLFNLHISSQDAVPIQYPPSEDQLADDYARLLFRMSSPLPPEMVEQAETIGIPISAGARGFVFNADMVSMVNFLDIGTRIRTGG
jgi:hypothetical protein